MHSTDIFDHCASQLFQCVALETQAKSESCAPLIPLVGELELISARILLNVGLSFFLFFFSQLNTAHRRSGLVQETFKPCVWYSVCSNNNLKIERRKCSVDVISHVKISSVIESSLH